MTENPEIRIADADRLQVINQLQTAFAEGRLDTRELEERLESVHLAKTTSELTPLVADLPPSPSALVAAGQPTESGRSLVAMLGGPLLVPPIICTVIWAITMPGGYFWPVWVWLGCMTPVLFAAFAGRGGTDHA